MIFEALFAFGALGLIVMTVLGFSHGAGSHGASHHGGAHTHHGLFGRLHFGSHHGHGTHGPAAHAHGTNTSSGQNESALRPHARHHGFSALALVPSPLDVFSLCLGAGLAGVLLRHVLSPEVLPIAAVAGALFFDLAIVHPLFAVFLQFASKPSAGLSGTIAFDAQAVTKFDAAGRGLVMVNMEGQLVQLLARLEPGEIAQGAQVAKGDRLVVTQVNEKTNTCQVTRELSL
jgi:hypothetical protein